MIEWTHLAAFLSLGLFGSLHCAGMCGGFAVAVAAAGTRPAPRVLARQLTYVLGKALSYAILALLFASGVTWIAGRDAGGSGEVFAGLRSALGWAAGLVLVLMGAGYLGLGRLVPPARRPRAPRLERLRALFAGVRALPGLAGTFGVGLFNGLIPCGLSWGALVLASQETPATALLGALLFGLATGPVLLSLGWGARLATPGLRRAAPLLLGVALVVYGGLTLARAARSGATGAAPACCPVHEVAPGEAGDCAPTSARRSD